MELYLLHPRVNPFENIEVTVQSPHIRGRVQRMDGKPVANAKVKHPFTDGKPTR